MQNQRESQPKRLVVERNRKPTRDDRVSSNSFTNLDWASTSSAAE